jgi:hypothetical protein
MKSVSGELYDGTWNRDRYEGHGTLYMVNGDIYQGMWSPTAVFDGEKEGFGQQVWSTELDQEMPQIYRGEWFYDR